MLFIAWIVISEEEINAGKSVTDDLASVNFAFVALPLALPPHGSMFP